MNTNTQQQQTNRDYLTDLTDQQFAELATLTDTWNNQCDSDHSDTFVGGVAHVFVNGAPLADGLSRADRNRLTQYFTPTTIGSGAVNIRDLERWVTQLEGYTPYRTDFFQFVEAVRAVLTPEQQDRDRVMDAAMAYCGKCCHRAMEEPSFNR